MTRFHATLPQLIQLCSHAINASTPRGMGFLDAKPGMVSLSDVELAVRCSLEARGRPSLYEAMISIDYFQGRMVKLHMFKEQGFWVLPAPHPDYQTWFVFYSSALDLLLSVPGIDILLDEAPTSRTI